MVGGVYLRPPEGTDHDVCPGPDVSRQGFPSAVVTVHRAGNGAPVTRSRGGRARSRTGPPDDEQPPVTPTGTNPSRSATWNRITPCSP